MIGRISKCFISTNGISAMRMVVLLKCLVCNIVQLNVPMTSTANTPILLPCLCSVPISTTVKMRQTYSKGKTHLLSQRSQLFIPRLSRKVSAMTSAKQQYEPFYNTVHTRTADTTSPNRKAIFIWPMQASIR